MQNLYFPMQNLYFSMQKEYEISRNFSEIFNILKIPYLGQRQTISDSPLRNMNKITCFRYG